MAKKKDEEKGKGTGEEEAKGKGTHQSDERGTEDDTKPGDDTKPEEEEEDNEPPWPNPEEDDDEPDVGDDLYKTWRSIILSKAEADYDKFEHGGAQFLIPIFNTLDNLYSDHRRYEITSEKDLEKMGNNFYTLIVNGQQNNKDLDQKAAILEAAYYFAHTIMPEMEEYHEARRKNMRPEGYYRWKDAFVNTVYNEYIEGVSWISRDEVPIAAGRVFDYFWHMYDRKLAKDMEDMSADELANLFNDNFFKDYSDGLDVHDSENMKSEMSIMGYRFMSFLRNHTAMSRIKDPTAKNWPEVRKEGTRPRVKTDENYAPETEEEEAQAREEEVDDDVDIEGDDDAGLGDDEDEGVDLSQELDPKYSGQKGKRRSLAVDSTVIQDHIEFLKPEEIGASLSNITDRDSPLNLKYTPSADNYQYVKPLIDGVMKSIKDFVIARLIQTVAETIDAYGRHKGGKVGRWAGKLYDAYINEDIKPLLNQSFNEVFGEGTGKVIYGLVQDLFYDTIDGKPRPIKTVARHSLMQGITLLTNKITKKWNTGFVKKIKEKAPKFIADRLIGDNRFRSNDPVAMMLGMGARAAYNAAFDAMNKVADKKIPYAAGIFGKDAGYEVRRIISENPRMKLPTNLKSLLGPQNRIPPTAEVTPTNLRGKPVGPVRREQQPKVRTTNVDRPKASSPFSDTFDQFTAPHPVQREVRALTMLASRIGRGKSINTNKELNDIINTAPANERESIRKIIQNNFKGMAVADIPKAAKKRLDTIMSGTAGRLPRTYEGELIKGMTRSGLSAFTYIQTKDTMANAAVLNVGSNAIKKGRDLGGEVAGGILKSNVKETAEMRAERAFYTGYVAANKKGYNHAECLMTGMQAATGVWGTSGNGTEDGRAALSKAVGDFSIITNDKKAVDAAKLEVSKTFSALRGKFKKLGHNSETLSIMDTMTKGLSRATVFLFNSKNSAAKIVAQQPLPFKATSESKLDVMNRKLAVAHKSRAKIQTKRRTLKDVLAPTHLDYGIINAVTMFPGGPDDFIDGMKQLGDASKEVVKNAAQKVGRVLRHPSTLFMLSTVVDWAPAIGGLVGFAASGGNPIIGAGGSLVAEQLAARAAGSIGGYLAGRAMKKFNPAQYRALTPPMFPVETAQKAKEAAPVLSKGQTVGVRKTESKVKTAPSKVVKARRQDPVTNEQQLAIDMFTMTDILKQVTTAIAIETVYGRQLEQGETPEKIIKKSSPAMIGLTAATAFFDAALNNPEISRMLRINLGNNASIGFSNKGISTDIRLGNVDLSVGTSGASASTRINDNTAGTINLDYSGVLSGMLHHSSGFTPVVAFGFAGDSVGTASVGLSYSGVPLIVYGNDGTLTLLGSVSRAKGGTWVLNNREALRSLVNLAGEVGINVLMRSSDNALVRNYGSAAIRIGTRGAAAAITRTAFIQAGKAGLGMITPAGWLFAANALFEIGSAIYRASQQRAHERMTAWNDHLMEQLKGIDAGINPSLKKFSQITEYFHGEGSQAYRRLMSASSFSNVSREDIRAARDEVMNYAVDAQRASQDLVVRANNHRQLVDMFDDEYLAERGLTREDLIRNSARLRSEVYYIRDEIKRMGRDALREGQRLSSMYHNYGTVQEGIKSGDGTVSEVKPISDILKPEKPESQRQAEQEMHTQRLEDLTKKTENIAFGLVGRVLSGETITPEEAEAIRTDYDQASGRKLSEEIRQNVIPLLHEVIDLMSVFDTEEDRTRLKQNVKRNLKGSTTVRVERDGTITGTATDEESDDDDNIDPADVPEDEMADEDDEESSEGEADRQRAWALDSLGKRLGKGIAEETLKFQSSQDYSELLKLANTAAAKDSFLMQLVSIDDVQLSETAYRAVLGKAYMALEAMNAKIDQLERSKAPQSEIEAAIDALNSLRSDMVQSLQNGAVGAYKTQFNDVLGDALESFKAVAKEKQRLYNKMYSKFKGVIEAAIKSGWGNADQLASRMGKGDGKTLWREILEPFLTENLKNLIFNSISGPSSEEEINAVVNNYRTKMNDIVSLSLNSKEFNGYSAFNDAVDLRGKILQLAQYIDDMYLMDEQLFDIARTAAMSQGSVIESSYSRADVHEESIALLEGKLEKYMEKFTRFKAGTPEHALYAKRIKEVEEQLEREYKDLNDATFRSLGSAERILGEVYNTYGQPLKGYLISAQELLDSIDGDSSFSRLGTSFAEIMNELRLGLTTISSQVEERMASSDVYSRGTLKDIKVLKSQYDEKGYSRSLIHELMAIRDSDVSTEKEKTEARKLLSSIETKIASDVDALNLKDMDFDTLKNMYKSMKTEFDNPLLYHIVKEYTRRKAGDTEEEGEQDKLGALARAISGAYDAETREHWAEFRTELLNSIRVTLAPGSLIDTSQIAQALLDHELADRDELIGYIAEHFENRQETYDGIIRDIKRRTTNRGNNAQDGDDGPSGEEGGEKPKNDEPDAKLEPEMRTKIIYTSAHNPNYFWEVPVIELKSEGVYPQKDGGYGSITEYAIYMYEGSVNGWQKVPEEDIGIVHKMINNNLGEQTKVILTFNSDGNTFYVESPNTKKDGIHLITCDNTKCTMTGQPLSASLFRRANTVEEFINMALKETNKGNVPMYVHKAFGSAGKFSIANVFLNNAKILSKFDGEIKPREFWEEIVAGIAKDLEKEVFKSTSEIYNFPYAPYGPEPRPNVPEEESEIPSSEVHQSSQADAEQPTEQPRSAQPEGEAQPQTSHSEAQPQGEAQPGASQSTSDAQPGGASASQSSSGGSEATASNEGTEAEGPEAEVHRSAGSANPDPHAGRQEEEAEIPGAGAGADSEPNQRAAGAEGRKITEEQERTDSGERADSESRSDADARSRAGSRANSRSRSKSRSRVREMLDSIAISESVPLTMPFPFIHIPIVDGQDPQTQQTPNPTPSPSPSASPTPTATPTEPPREEEIPRRRRTPKGRPPDDPIINPKPRTTALGHTLVHFEPSRSIGNMVQWGIENMFKDFNTNYKGWENIFNKDK